MSDGEPASPWWTVLTVLTVLAIANAWFKPFDQADADTPPASLALSPTDEMVRHTPGWALFATATVTPGVQTLTGNSQCTTNFVFTDEVGNVYVGQAAHCASLSTEESNDCRAISKPIGTRVTFNLHGTHYDAGQQLAKGRLAYSSWRAMRRLGETDPNACRYNDFALVKVDPGDRSKVNPSMPYWGGPTGISERGLHTLDHAYGFGRSSLRKDGSPYSRQAAQAMSDPPEADGWTHQVVAQSPGIPGDSGSGYVDMDGLALGTLSSLAFGSVLVNGLGDLRQELLYARTHSGIRGLKLEVGTVPFQRERAEAALRVPDTR